MSVHPLRAFLVLKLALLTVACGPVFAAQPAASADRGVIVVFGASYVKDWPIQDIGGARVVNAGVGGNETKDLAARFESDVLARSPDYVLLWGFINDFTRNKPEQAEQLTAQIKQRYQGMIETARERNLPLIVATEVTLPAATSWWGEILAWLFRLLGRESYADRINANVMAVNDWLKQYASEQGVPLLDFQAALAPDGLYRDRDYAQPDGSHLSEAAYQRLTSYTQSQQALLRK